MIGCAKVGSERPLAGFMLDESEIWPDSENIHVSL